MGRVPHGSGARCPGSLAPWLPGSLAPWLPGSLAPWGPRPAREARLAGGGGAPVSQDLRGAKTGWTGFSRRAGRASHDGLDGLRTGAGWAASPGPQLTAHGSRPTARGEGRTATGYRLPATGYRLPAAGCVPAPVGQGVCVCGGQRSVGAGSTAMAAPPRPWGWARPWGGQHQGLSRGGHGHGRGGRFCWSTLTSTRLGARRVRDEDDEDGDGADDRTCQSAGWPDERTRPGGSGRRARPRRGCGSRFNPRPTAQRASCPPPSMIVSC
jgi:hypothetical protein